jgi:hypothetical protein
VSSLTRLDASGHVDRANQRAKDLAKRIAQRVRYITIAY